MLGEQAGEILWSADVRAAEILDLARGGTVELSDLYERARAECEQLLTAAQIEADKTLETARRQAATIDERARQEYAWRRRQVRQEQDLVDQRKQQIVRQIVTLSALAAKTAGSPMTAEVAEDGPSSTSPSSTRSPSRTVARPRCPGHAGRRSPRSRR